MKSANLLVKSQPKEIAGMLRSLKDLEGYRISAKNGDIGKIHDFFFDDELWIVRYVVVDTGHWLPGRKVLLAPSVLLDPNWRERSFSVLLTQEEVKASPDIDADKPVSRQHEIELRTYYGWPFYWQGAGPVPGMLPPPMPPPPPSASQKAGDLHLRSVRAVSGYDIEATDGDIGHADDFIADDETWAIRYLIVATRKWLPGRKVLISPQWLVGPISWSSKRVKIIMTRESIRNSPEYNPAAPVNREYEVRLYDYYGRPQYWHEPGAARG